VLIPLRVTTRYQQVATHKVSYFAFITLFNYIGVGQVDLYCLHPHVSVAQISFTLPVILIYTRGVRVSRVFRVFLKKDRKKIPIMIIERLPL